MSRLITFTLTPLLLFWWRVPLPVFVAVIGLMLLVSWRIRRAARAQESPPPHRSTCGCARCTNEMYQRYGRYR